ncbi:MAG: L,D-transpeptidase [Clostridia bacterium]|nr:L,D-transpeptidase [Clostridia bacterium]
MKILLLIIVIFLIILILKNKFNTTNTVQTSNNNSCTYKILVDVEDSKLFLFENNVLVKIYKCSGGKWSTPSPIGTWRITSKAKWGEGFGGSWLRIKCSLGAIWNSWNIG